MAIKLGVIHPYLDPLKTYAVSISIQNQTADGKKGINWQGMAADKVNLFLNEVYQKGFAYRQKETGTIELISPFNINQILIMPENK